MSPPLLPQDITMTSETEETVLDLLPCPFCGCARIYERGFRCFECPECRAEGPTKATKAEAVAAWNTRAALSRAPEAEDRYEALGRACEMHGLGWYNEQGEMRFQPPADMIAEQAVAELLAALSPPSTGGEGEAVAWRCLNVHGDAFLTEHANGAYFWAKSGKPVQPLYLHPSPEMGEISREVARIAVGHFVKVIRELGNSFSPGGLAATIERKTEQQIDAILSKLKENGLSREELGGLARSQPGAAGPSDCAETDVPLSDGGEG